MIGSAIGTAVGMVGGPVGAIVGGAIGGAVGGMFGPGRARSFGNVNVDANDNGRLGITGSGGRNFDTEEALRAARRDIESLNDLLDQRGFRISGSTFLGSGVAGVEQFGSIGESTALRLRTGDARVDGAIDRAGGGSLDRQLAVAERAQGFADQLDQMTNAIRDTTDPLGGIIRQFDEMREQAARIGFGLEEIAQAQAAALEEFYRNRQRAAEDQSLGLNARITAATGNRSDALAVQQLAMGVQQQRDRDDLVRQAAAAGFDASWITDLQALLERAIAAEQQAMVDAWEDLWRAQREAVQGLAARATRARATLSGSAVDAQRADLQAFDLRAASEIIDTRRALLDLGIAAESVDAEILKLTATHDLERQAVVAAYQARRQAITESLDDRLFAAMTDTQDLPGALAALERQALRERTQAAREGLTDMVQLEAVHAAERAKLIEDFARQSAERIRALGVSIRTFLDGLRTNAAYASPQDRFTAAQGQFTRDLGLARGGDQEALGRITGTADTLLTAGRDMFASGPQFQALMAMVRTSLEGLPALRDYDALILAELQKLQGGISVGVELETIRVISETLNALPDADRARLVQSGTVARLVEERLGRALTAAELAMVVQQGTVPRTITQTVQAATGAQIITAADIARTISLSFDYAVAEQFSYLHNLADIRMFLSHLRDMARGGAGGLRVTTYQASGAANDDFARVSASSTTRNLIGQPASFQNWGGLQAGGWVGNGTWNRDSVMAGYAGGGQIMLAGGEHVTNAVQAARYRPVLDSINAGTFAADSGAVVRELRALRQDNAALQAEMAALRNEVVALRGEAERTADATEDTAQTNRTMARDGAVVGARQRRAG
jgi:hypothetical protein